MKLLKSETGIVLLPKGLKGVLADREPAGSHVLVAVSPAKWDEFFRVLGVIRGRLQVLKELLGRLRSENSPSYEAVKKILSDVEGWRDGAFRLQQALEKEGVDLEGLKAVGPLSDFLTALNEVRALVDLAKARGSISIELHKKRDEFIARFSRVGARNQGTEQLSVEAFELYRIWVTLYNLVTRTYDSTVLPGENVDGKAKLRNELNLDLESCAAALTKWMEAISRLEAAQSIATDSRRPLDHKKFLDMLIDDLEEKYIELMEGTRAHTANIDNYIKRLTTSLDDDFNRQFYYPAFRLVREASQFKRVEFGQTETTNVLVNNRQFGKVSPSATMEFDLPERDILIAEALDAGLAIYNDVGALINDPNMLGLLKSQMGGTATPPAGSLGGRAAVRSLLPGLQGDSAEQLLAQNAGSGPDFESNVERLIPDPAIYKFETGTGYEIRPVIAPDGQAVVFDFNYLYRTQIREPVRADEKHLGRVRQHFIDTDVQLSNFELREVSRYVVALKAERTANGVPLLEDIPLVGALWRPLPNREKSLQQNIVMAQATIFPTLFDLMGLRWAPTVADLDPLRISNREYLVRGRQRYIENRIYDYSSSRVDEHLQIPDANRRADLYRSQESIPSVHPNGYRGQGLDYENSQMREGYDPEEAYVNPGYIPSRSADGALYLPHREKDPYNQMPRGTSLIEEFRPSELAPPADRPHISPQGAPNPTIIQSMPGFLDTSAVPQQHESYRRPEPMRPTAIQPQMTSQQAVQQPVTRAAGIQPPPRRVAMQPRHTQPARAMQPHPAQPAPTRFPEYPPYQSPQQPPRVSPASGQTQGGIVPAAPIQVGVPAGTGASSSSW